MILELWNYWNYERPLRKYVTPSMFFLYSVSDDCQAIIQSGAYTTE